MTIITVAVCAEGGLSRSGITIDSLLKQSLDPSHYDILIIDCMSETAGELPPPPNLREVTNLTLIGAPEARTLEARQLALESTASPHLALLSPNAIAGRRWLETICASFSHRDPEGGVIGGKVEPLWGDDKPVWVHDSLLPLLGIVDLGPGPRPLTRTDYLSSANVAFQVATLKANGGFEQDPLYADDERGTLPMSGCRLIDIYTRDGLEVIWEPNAEVRLRLTPSSASQENIRGRMAQKAVRDFIRDQDRMAQELDPSWERIHGYFDSVPARLRNPNGLFEDWAEPERFLAQTHLVYDSMLTLLLGQGALPLPGKNAEYSETAETLPSVVAPPIE